MRIAFEGRQDANPLAEIQERREQSADPFRVIYPQGERLSTVVCFWLRTRFGAAIQCQMRVVPSVLDSGQPNFERCVSSTQLGYLGLLSLNSPRFKADLLLLLPDLLLLLFDRLNQQRGQAAVVDALRISAVGFIGDDFRYDLADFFGDYPDLVFAARFEIVGDTAQILDFS